jgi:transposase-like protein
LKCLSEGNGIRATSRIVGVSKDTVGSIINRIGDHMEDVAATLMTDYVNAGIKLSNYSGIKLSSST